MPHLVAAPDKYRGTASAPDMANAVANAARAARWSATPLPLADGGEGTLDAVGGERRVEVVHGPFGQRVAAEWRFVAGEDGPTGVVEMARASGRDVSHRRPPDAAVRASTYGTGELIAAAVAAGARRIVVGCGGSATTDGGAGALAALAALGGPKPLADAELLVACDVTTPFLDAARLFGPQKGASPDEVAELDDRLRHLADRYRTELGVDVTLLPGAGAAGGLAGGLAALGGRIVSGFDLVADIVGLDDHLAQADLVVTGEGRLDATSLSGKVVSGVITRLAGRCPVLVVAGATDGTGADELAGACGVAASSITVVELVGRYGETAATSETLRLASKVVSDVIRERSPS